MIKYIIVSSHSSPNLNKAQTVNHLPGKPILLPPHARVSLVDITFPSHENESEISMNQLKILFPVDNTKNDDIIIEPNSSIETINAQVSNVVARKVGNNLKSNELKFKIYDMMVQAGNNYWSPDEPGKKEIWFEEKGEPRVHLYQPPYLYIDKHENIVYQINGYYDGNLPILMDLPDCFLKQVKYGGVIFTPKENSERVGYFSRWKFCKKEIGSSFPMQKATKTLTTVAMNNSLNYVYKIPPITADDRLRDEMVRRTKEISISCNLIAVIDGNNDQELDSFVISPDLGLENFGYFLRQNIRVLEPKKHRVGHDKLQTIELNIKDKHTGRLLNLTIGEVIATLAIHS